MDPPQLSRPPKKDQKRTPTRGWIVTAATHVLLFDLGKNGSPNASLIHSTAPSTTKERGGRFLSLSLTHHTARKGPRTPAAMHTASQGKKMPSHQANRPTVPLVDSPTQQLLNTRPVGEKHAQHPRHTLPQGEYAPSSKENVQHVPRAKEEMPSFLQNWKPNSPHINLLGSQCQWSAIEKPGWLFRYSARKVLFQPRNWIFLPRVSKPSSQARKLLQTNSQNDYSTMLPPSSILLFVFSLFPFSSIKIFLLINNWRKYPQRGV
jgi:hypothetical protein